MNAFHEDGEYAFYRNIRDEPDFPFARILNTLKPTLKKYFEIRNVEEELRLDDAFCIHYNTDQYDTTGKAGERMLCLPIVLQIRVRVRRRGLAMLPKRLKLYRENPLV